MRSRLKWRLEPICFKVTSILVGIIPEPPIWIRRRIFGISVWLSALIIWIVGLFVIIPYIKGGLKESVDYVPLTVGVIGALFLGTVGFLGLYVNYRRTRAFEKQLEQQLYATNIEHLGNTSESVKLGGIYGLERLAKESKDSGEPWVPKVAEILCAHIRTTTIRDGYGDENESKPLNEIAAILKVLTKGEDNPFGLARFDLSGANLSGADLNGADLRRADLSETNLSGADIRGANLSGADLSEAMLSKTNDNLEIIGADLSEATLIGAKLYRAELRGVNLTEADLRGADLTRADLTGAYLAGATLNETRLNQATLNETNLKEADLRGSDLTEADLTGANLREADLRGADLIETTLGGTILAKTNLKRVNLWAYDKSVKASLNGGIFSSTYIGDIYWGVLSQDLKNAIEKDRNTGGRENRKHYLDKNAKRQKPTPHDKEYLVGKNNVNKCIWGNLLVL